jgi:predicted metalloprotease with PDZ domain
MTPHHTSQATLHYRIAPSDLHAHLFEVSLRIERPAAQQTVSLPVWIPGSYLVREFAKHLQDLSATQNGVPLPIQQIDKCSWRINCSVALDNATARSIALSTDALTSTGALQLNWRIYAFDPSVRAAWLGSDRGFFNGTSVFLRVHGQELQPHALEIAAAITATNDAAKRRTPPAWRVATSLRAVHTDAQGFGHYWAQDYDELVDCPVALGDFWRGQFSVNGIAHDFVVSGAAPSFDGQRLLADAQRICQATQDFWHPPQQQAAAAVTVDVDVALAAPSTADTPRPLAASSPAPFSRYVFLLNAVADGYGGLEHCNSTALICKRADLPSLKPSSEGSHPAPSAGYTTLLGLISHEYFHAWNVKCLRPAQLVPYDYARENYTELLWFFEGFTSYFDDLLLRRSNLINDDTYLSLLQKNLQHLAQTPGQHVHSVAQASFEAWTKYYRADENTPNATVSYYSKGAAIALCLDLSLRQLNTPPDNPQPAQRPSLDALMRGLWRRTQADRHRAAAVSEADILAELHHLTGRDWTPELQAWVHGTQPLPTTLLLHAQGVRVSAQPLNLAQSLGLRAHDAGEADNTSGSVKIKTVLRGSWAEQAGLAAGDEWLGVDDWRLLRLNDLPLLVQPCRTDANNDVHAPASDCTALISRDGKLLKLNLPPNTALLCNNADQAAARGGDTALALPLLHIESIARVAHWLGDKRLDAHTSPRLQS